MKKQDDTPEAIARAFLEHLRVVLKEETGKPIVGKWEHPALEQPLWLRLKLRRHDSRKWLSQAQVQIFSAETYVQWGNCMNDHVLTLAIEESGGEYLASFFPTHERRGIVAMNADLVQAYSFFFAAWSEFAQKNGLGQFKEKASFEL